MIQYKINGERLDLYDGTEYQLQASNLLFAFDDAAAERSTSFALPCTVRNENIFKLAGKVATFGAGMRQRYAATMEDGIVTKRGYLYLENHDPKKKEYKAVFVTGDLADLVAVKDAGKISEYLTPTDVTRWDSQSNAKAATATLANFESVKYINDSDNAAPSVSLDYLLNLGATHFGMTIGAHAATSGVRVVLGQLNGIGMYGATLRTTADGTGGIVNNIYTADLGSGIFTGTTRTLSRYFVGVLQPYTFQIYNPNAPVTLTFPANTPATYRLITVTGEEADPTTGTTLLAEPMANKRVEIPAWTPFIVVNTAYYQEGLGFQDLAFLASTGVDVEGTDGEAHPGEAVRLVDNLPDIEFNDLLKTVAALEGKVLYYERGAGISFDPLNFATWPIIELKDVTEHSSTNRRFGDYKQHNRVVFDSDDYIPGSARLSVDYTLQNDNLEADSELQKIPFSEGNRAGRNVRISDANEFNNTMAKKSTTAYLDRVALGKCAGLQNLLDAATTIEIEARGSLYEYERLTPKTRILWQNTTFCWLEKRWSGQKMALLLAKIQ